MFPLLLFAAVSPGNPASTQFDADFDASLGVEHQPAPAPAGGNAPKKVSKVELDLEGAPFLQPDEPEPPPKKQEPVKAPPVKPEEAPAKVKRKISKKTLLTAAGVLLLLSGAAVYFLLLRNPAEPGVATPNIPGQTVVVVPSTPQVDPAPTDQFIIDFPQFWVELKDNEGEIRFLNCKILVPSNSEINVGEINAKMTLIRDALYYYMKNKPYSFLVDNKNMDVLKKDLAEIISGNLTTEKVNEVLLENYIIK
ncbi:MAG: flagellar basal body-associated FliL family protein [Deltaproteobacteria bacterium]|jgi:flagellar FliL protein|nr:flagellar basal body-associated FliL family protein [Deltaproteobacteria bacterium]